MVFWSQTPGCCALVCCLCLCWKGFVFNAERHKLRFFLLLSALIVSQWLWQERGPGDGTRKTNQKNRSLKERKPWLTLTASCASDETEEEEVKPLRAPHWPVGSFQFKGIVAEQLATIRFSILSWNAGLLRGKATNSVVVPLPRSRVAGHGNCRKTATEQFHIYQCADQLIMFHKTTFEPAGVKTDEEVIRSKSKQDSFGLTRLMVGSVFRRAPKQGTCTVHVSNMIAKESRNYKHASGLVEGSCRAARRWHHWTRTRKGEVELNLRGKGRGAADSCARCGSNVEPDGGLRRLLWLHIKRRGVSHVGVWPGMDVSNFKKKMHMKVTDHAAHLPVLVHICETHTTERSARNDAAKDSSPREEERRREKKG